MRVDGLWWCVRGVATHGVRDNGVSGYVVCGGVRGIASALLLFVAVGVGLKERAMPEDCGVGDGARSVWRQFPRRRNHVMRTGRLHWRGVHQRNTLGYGWRAGVRGIAAVVPAIARPPVCCAQRGGAVWVVGGWGGGVVVWQVRRRRRCVPCVSALVCGVVWYGVCNCERWWCLVVVMCGVSVLVCVCVCVHGGVCVW